MIRYAITIDGRSRRSGHIQDDLEEAKKVARKEMRYFRHSEIFIDIYQSPAPPVKKLRFDDEIQDWVTASAL